MSSALIEDTLDLWSVEPRAVKARLRGRPPTVARPGRCWRGCRSSAWSATGATTPASCASRLDERQVRRHYPPRPADSSEVTRVETTRTSAGVELDAPIVAGQRA